jgi:hypothetical protein
MNRATPFFTVPHDKLERMCTHAACHTQMHMQIQTNMQINTELALCHAH